ncbi:KdgR [Planococcus antarcticus DSM 14505]|uniref:KdgR n=1 Tax=Planococcus antarcticus DSM 14505 TaxID=1185653 RepID=A0A1C7DKW6_9BACL|nr:substrate-binding domain-containing protein [Planococcus antarcticus]ANU11921.1 LacI family transcriptional regulator [Planococcus antarcticus DSM 14505]EIM05258.1 KdgR [Planococcus antarcticus DSM 14505]
MKTVTMADVAKHANVSKSTISQYLNKRFDYMSEDTKNRIEETIRFLDYRPNILARSLKQKSTTTIGVIVANILHTFSSQIIRTVEDVCNETDFHVMVCNADDDPVKEKKYIEMLRAKQVDGIILLPTGINVELYKEMALNKYPVVFVDRTVPGVQIPSVLLDNEKAGEIAVQHFINNGFERIGIITNIIKNVTPRKERVKGYKEALLKNGFAIRDEYIKNLEVSNVQKGLEEMMALPEPPQAILAGNDLVLIEILKHIKKQNIRIPNDLAVVGIDEVSFSTFYEPGLTIIEQPAIEIGKKAAELLLNKIQTKDFESETAVYRYDPKMVVRESSNRIMSDEESQKLT